MDNVEILKLTYYGDNNQLPDPNLLLLYEGFKDREIWLDEEITWESVSLLIKYIQHENRHAADNPKPIMLHIFSNGGEIRSTFALYHAIKSSKIPVYTINEGDAHSGAFIIFLAGQKRYMTKFGLIISHEGSVNGGNGTYRETKAAQKQYDREIENMRKIIVENTTITIEELSNKFETEQDFYINYEEAVKYGIVTDELSELEF